MKVIYWSGTDNTEAIASLIAKSIAKQSKEERCIKFGEEIAKL